MELVAKLVIPTRSKAKISHLLSYPVGAERISEALIDVPQFSTISLNFYAAMGSGLREVGLSGKQGYEFLRVEYLNQATPASDWPIMTLYQRPPQHMWEVTVLPVPRSDRHSVRKYIDESALPLIERWFSDRGQQVRQGSDVLAFFRQSESEEFFTHQVTELHSTLR